MVNNVLYVGMMYDITTLINLEETVDNIYVIDKVDLSYGKFIKGKKNSWITLQEKIKNILINGFYIDPFDKVKQMNKLGKAQIISEENINIDIKKNRWSLKFRYENINKEINMIFYAGYCTEDEWPLDVKNINCIISIGACFYRKLGGDSIDEITKNMIIERCNLPLSHYMLYFNCNKKYYKRINKYKYKTYDDSDNTEEDINKDDIEDNIEQVKFCNEIGRTKLRDFSEYNLMKLYYDV